MTRAPFEAKQLNGAYYLPEQGRLECVLHKLYAASLCVHVSLNVALGGGECSVSSEHLSVPAKTLPEPRYVVWVSDPLQHCCCSVEWALELPRQLLLALSGVLGLILA